jgi:hypothetical protein
VFESSKTYVNNHRTPFNYFLTCSGQPAVEKCSNLLYTSDYRKASRTPPSLFMPRVNHRNTLEGFRIPKSKVDGNSSRFYKYIKNDKAIAATTSNLSKYLFQTPTGNSRRRPQRSLQRSTSLPVDGPWFHLCLRPIHKQYYDTIR